jgi:hypothetical protein
MTDKKQPSLFDESNEVKSSFVGWGKVGDYFIGTLMGKREVENKLPGKPAGTMQMLYEFKMREGQFHKLDDKKNPVADATVIGEGELWTLGGKAGIDAQMRNIKIGQVLGMKFLEEIPSKTKGFNPTKVVQVYTSGEMDSSVMAGVGGEVAED